MTRRRYVEPVAAIVIVVFVGGILFGGERFKWAWLDYYSLAVLVATVVFFLWDKFLWRRGLPQRMGLAPRDVSGTWRGTLASFWEDPSTGERIPPKTAYLVVRQTARTVSAVLLTDESKSASSLATVGGPEGIASLDYMYTNWPRGRVDHRSRAHRGSASLSVTGLPVTRLQGEYWTDRNTRGELDFASRRTEKADDFDEAGRLFGV
jgi:hypothetical protein